ncbi:MAG TPA: penicillin-binding protein, partial [Sphingobacteriaceae bacterium]|nr:penicillin-binding protein [Sphingobacteriaceae bacterium]
HTGELDAQNLFDSFPVGLFESLDGIKVAGKLQYDLDFYLDSAQPDSVRFDAGFKKKNFRIVSNGKTNLQKLNGPFVFTPYESGKPVRDILISDQNPNYVPIADISPYLKNAVMTAEDPSFFYHHGFVMEAFRGSIAADFKAKYFKRGGSTISMQLIKNVYLNREKTIARKIEEIMIVWLIENTNISRKERMFEVYLNLIEWGRNVYGIGEASRYYFNKHPSQLSLGESIFLANIVPRPKSSLYFFEPDGSLRYALKDYFNFIGGVMARRGLTTADTAGSYGFYDVRLKESLRTEITPLDFIATDRLLLDDDMTEERDILKEILGKKQKPDTINVRDLKNLKVIPKDTVKSPADLRKERREDRRRARVKP